MPHDPTPESPREGHPDFADEARRAVPPARGAELLGEAIVEVPQGSPTLASAEQPEGDMEQAVASIRYWHRRRAFAMEQRKRMDLALGSFLRLVLGWSRALPKEESDRIKAQVKALIEIGEADYEAGRLAEQPVRSKREETKLAKLREAAQTDEPAYAEWRDVILANTAARAPFDSVEERATAEMERLAKSLPAWASFGEGVKGFGAVSLAVIVGEAGDLSAYPKKGHLWKRMGLAVMGGVRQGGLSKNAKSEEWIAHGYNAKRRSQMFVIGDVLVKVGEHYRSIYLARKEYERRKAAERGLTVVPAAKIPKGRTAEFMSDGHIHKRAQRYMEKRLLRDLWQAWQR